MKKPSLPRLPAPMALLLASEETLQTLFVSSKGRESASADPQLVTCKNAAG